MAVIATMCLAAGTGAAQEMAGQAVTLLNHVNMARQAEQMHDQNAALQNVRQASDLANRILQEAASQPKPVVVTIAREGEITTTYGQVKRPKHDDGVMTATRMKRNTSVREVQEDVNSQSLDVSSAADRLQAAQAALEQQNWSAADDALANIQQSVIRTRSAGDMPLLQVKQNLELARARMLEGKYGAAVMPLRSAAQAMADFERLNPGPRAEDADSIRVQMLDRADKIHHDHAETLDWINHWLATVNQWQHQAGVHQH